MEKLPAKMKAIVKDGPHYGAKMMTVDVPKDLEAHEVLVKVKAVSICGTDLHIWLWNEWAKEHINVPQVLGHEFAGEVVAVGSEVSLVKIGDFVSSETHIPCGHCKQCRTGNMHVCQNLKILGVDMNGAFAEYVKVPEIVLWKNDPSIPSIWASVQEPLGNAIHTIFTEDVTGKNVLVTGAGPIGLLAIGVLKTAGAAKIIVSEVNEYRRNLAKEIGADVVVNPKNQSLVDIVKKETDGDGADVLIEMSGNPQALHDGLASLTNAGRASLLGVYDKDVQINLNDLVIFKAIRVYGITGRKMFETWYKGAELLKNKKLDLSKIITHVLDFDDYEKGFKLMEEGKCGKVVLKL
ncbi:L-threonine 3-dehydrogenase [Athalassotoga saccharophila]|uniref:L-threonine 3-dehydrogenase n=1 Tax=Athalassotoga saccharophila TaxID=1441386 RepID=UPI0018DA0278|nr:L-threonine 3-dehydrogenase [Athalassotoga saccharophila]